MTRWSRTTTWRKLGWRTRGETERQDVQHQWRRDIQDQHSAHETRHLTSECARSLLVSFVQSCVVIFTHCTPHRGSTWSCARLSSHPCMKWASLFDFELSIPFNFLFSLFVFNFTQLLLPFYFHEDSSNTVYSAKKEMGSTDESYLPTTCVTPVCVLLLLPLHTGNLIAAAGRPRRRRLDREVVERRRFAQDVHSCSVCVTCLTSLFVVVFLKCANGLTWERADGKRESLCKWLSVVFTICVYLFASRKSPFACWRHSTCATLLWQMRPVHLIFAVPVLQMEEQIVASPRSPPWSMGRWRCWRSAFWFFHRAGDRTGGRATFDRAGTAVAFCFQHVLEDACFGSHAKARATARVDVPTRCWICANKVRPWASRQQITRASEPSIWGSHNSCPIALPQVFFISEPQLFSRPMERFFIRRAGRRGRVPCSRETQRCNQAGGESVATYPEEETRWEAKSGRPAHTGLVWMGGLAWGASRGLAASEAARLVAPWHVAFGWKECSAGWRRDRCNTGACENESSIPPAITRTGSSTTQS